MSEKPKLKDVINYKEDIAPYKVVFIKAGVGAGKNEWAESVIPAEHRVLVITSRVSKVEEAKYYQRKEAEENGTLNISEINDSINISQIKEDSDEAICEGNWKKAFREYHNWDIEWYMKYIYDSDNSYTHIWNYFDLVVFDEVHALATDATFCNAPFYTLEFMKNVYYSQNTKIVMMTATPGPVEKLLSFKKVKNYNVMDVREKCGDVCPQVVNIVPEKLALSHMMYSYNKNKDKPWYMVYFATKLSHIKNIVTFLIQSGVPEACIAISFSKDDKSERFSKILMDNKQRTEDYLAKNNTLPGDIKFFITTSKNKEGINIKDKNCTWEVIIESHWDIEIYQMWGRIRENLQHVFVVEDAAQHISIDLAEDLTFKMDIDNLKILNENFKKWCIKEEITEKNKFQNKRSAAEIRKMHKKFPYLRYSVLDNMFAVYKGRIAGIKDFRGSIEDFNYMKDNRFTAEYTIMNIPCNFYDTMRNKAMLEEYMRKKNISESSILTLKEQKEMLDYINNVMYLRQKNGKLYSTLGKAVRMCGYYLEQVGKNVKRDGYGNVRIKKII